MSCRVATERLLQHNHPTATEVAPFPERAQAECLCYGKNRPEAGAREAAYDGRDSAILVVVRERLVMAAAVLMLGWPALGQQGVPASGASQGPPPQARVTVGTVVIDPAHGGPDAGARGAGGVIESEVVLTLARLLRGELERHGWRVVLTRQGNDNPSFDERATIANGQRGAVFISLHVSSTGPVSTARAYSMPQAASPGENPLAERPGVVRWETAQEMFAARSRRLAELVQIQLAQKFRGSAEAPPESPVRQLKTIAAPAIAIEVSSVSVPDRTPLEQMAQPLAEAVARALAAFRSLGEGGEK